MQFQFYELAAGSLGLPILQPLAEADFDAPELEGISSIQSAVEQRFSELVKERLGTGLVIVISPTLGEKPGSIVAVEVSEDLVNRELKWTYHHWAEIY